MFVKLIFSNFRTCDYHTRFENTFILIFVNIKCIFFRVSELDSFLIFIFRNILHSKGKSTLRFQENVQVFLLHFVHFLYLLYYISMHGNEKLTWHVIIILASVNDLVKRFLVMVWKWLLTAKPRWYPLRLPEGKG